jgi:hypothetical protein
MLTTLLLYHTFFVLWGIFCKKIKKYPRKKRKTEIFRFGRLKLLVFVSAFLNKIILGGTAQGADPIGGKILKIGILRNSVVNVTQLGVILVTAQLTNMNQHTLKILLFVKCLVLNSKAYYIILHSAFFVNTLFGIFSKFDFFNKKHEFSVEKIVYWNDKKASVLINID